MQNQYTGQGQDCQIDHQAQKPMARTDLVRHARAPTTAGASAGPSQPAFPFVFSKVLFGTFFGGFFESKFAGGEGHDGVRIARHHALWLWVAIDHCSTDSVQFLEQANQSVDRAIHQDFPSVHQPITGVDG